MKYLILIYSNPESRQVWESYSEAERAEGWRAYSELIEDLAESGELVVAEALAGPSLSRRPVTRDGQLVTSDGPFAEVKEYLAGFFLVECEGMDKAVEYAARIPETEFGLVEVRPVLHRNGMEM